LVTTIVRENTRRSQTRCVQPIPVLPSASTDSVGEQASEIDVRRETLAWVCGRSGFWGAYSRLLASSARPALIKFLVAGVVRGTALHASTSYDYIEHTYEMSRVNSQCLEHRSLRRVQYVLYICVYFIVVYCLYRHMHGLNLQRRHASCGGEYCESPVRRLDRDCTKVAVCCCMRLQQQKQ
jgi:hypothetical protein